MSYLAGSEYNLVLEVVTGNTAPAREELTQILTSQCGFKLIELEELLDSGPLVVKRASSKEELDGLLESLASTGATVSIIRNITAPKSAPLSAEVSFRSFYERYLSGLQQVLAALDPRQIEEFANDMCKARETKQQVFFIGNGGSASSASHFANDFSKVRFENEALLFRVMSLTDNVSWMSAIGNDFGYEFIFEHQLRNLLTPNDIVVAISSSGNSPNIIRAIDSANSRGALTYGIVGFDGGKLRDCARKTIYIPTKKGQYGFMEDATLIIGHIASVYLYEYDKARQSN